MSLVSFSSVASSNLACLPAAVFALVGSILNYTSWICAYWSSKSVVVTSLFISLLFSSITLTYFSSSVADFWLCSSLSAYSECALASDSSKSSPCKRRSLSWVNSRSRPSKDTLSKAILISILSFNFYRYLLISCFLFVAEFYLMKL